MSFDSHYHTEKMTQDRIKNYQQEAEKEAIINEAKSAEASGIRQAIGQIIINIGTKIAQPERQQA